MFSLCIKFGVIPHSFCKGLMIPLLKKPNADPTCASNYRPIVISVTFAKLLEIHILDESGEHEFHDMQFGFIPGRSTTMAAALAHDVIDYCNCNGSAVYACSLDADAAFDGIPHSIMFQKVRGVLQDKFW